MIFERLISICFHPIFMPLIMFHAMVITIPEIKFILSYNVNLTYWIIIISSIIVPLVSTFVFTKINKTDSLEMAAKEERVVPLLYSSASILLGCMFLNNLFLYTPILLVVFFGASIISLIASLISVFWKISLHMLGVGGALGAFIAIGLLYNKFISIIIFFTLIAGFVAFARLKSNAHNEAQVYVGFFLGLFIEMLITLNYSDVISIISIFLSSIASIL